jgi:hypothetical protein
MRMCVCSVLPDANRIRRCFACGSTDTTVSPTSKAAGRPATVVRAPVI